MNDVVKVTGPGPARKFRDMGDGSHAEVVFNYGAVSHAAPDFVLPSDLLEAWGNFSGVNWAGGDFVTMVSTSNGQKITAISASTINPGESYAVFNQPVRVPCEFRYSGSIVRNKHQFAAAGVFQNGDSGPDVIPNPINIVSIYQSSADLGAAYNATAGSICTVVLESPIPDVNENGSVYLTDWFHTDGLADSRLNYQNCAIKFISADRKTITFGFSDEAALPSLAIPAVSPALGTAKIYFYNNASGARQGAGWRFTGTTATSAAIWTMFGGEDLQISGTPLGDHRVTIGSTAPVYALGVMGNYEIRPTSVFRLDIDSRNVVFFDKSTDSSSSVFANRMQRNEVKPDLSSLLLPRFRIYQPVGMTRPRAKVIRADHASASTTTVLTLDRSPLSAGFQVGSQCTYKGGSNQTNFAASATPAAITAIDDSAKTVTMAWGAAVAGTSWGGALVLVNGGVDQPGIIVQAAQAVVPYSLNTAWLQITGSAAWAGASVGDYIDAYGFRDQTTGADVGVDGAWEVANISTTGLIVKPIIDVFGRRVSPVFSPSLPSTNCGGALILRTTMRSHDFMLMEKGDMEVSLRGQGTSNIADSIPVNLVSGGVTTVTANEGTPQTGSAYSLTSAASTNAASIKATAGNVTEVSIFNPTAAAIYLKLYNKASAPTVGTDVPIMTIPVAVGALFQAELGRFGKRFSTGIALAITGAAASTDATAIAAGAQISLTYN